jgi:hypothetical protein
MKRTKRWLAATLWLLVALIMPAICAAQTSTAAQAPQSVTFKIEDVATKLNKALGDGLGQRLEELQTTLKDASARVHAALDRAQREQTQEANNAYEMVISGELLHVQSALQAIVGEQDSVIGAQRDFSRRLDEIRTSLTKDEATWSRQAKERQVAVDTLSNQLQGVLDRNLANVKAGTQLANDENFRVLKLADDLRHAQQSQAIAEQAVKQINSVGERVRSYDERVSSSGGTFALLFNRAGGQVQLLGEVADMRKRGVEISSLLSDLSRVGQQMSAIDKVLQTTSSTLDELMAAPIIDSDMAPQFAAPSTARTGLDVLKELLERRQGRGNGGGQ